ncbi:hypothetical protein FGB62_95g063 [Gracilaria domingensis]|nr:hypothetical protein FGB62_95g063 [Gracilaria domingensis]
MPRRGRRSARKVHLLQLPDELLLRVLRELMCDESGTRNAGFLRDACNVAKTCKKLYELSSQMSSALRATTVQMEDEVPYDVVASIHMPTDVVHGALAALRTGGASLRTVQLSTLTQSQLQAAMQFLRHSPLLTELCFVDAQDGVDVPKEVALRLQTLSIVRPQERTLYSLCKGRCAPRNLKLLNFNDRHCPADVLDDMWRRLTRKCTSIDITQADCRLDAWTPPLTNVQRHEMRIKERRGEAQFEVQHTYCLRAEGLEDGRFVASTTSVSQWIATSYINDNNDGGAMVVLHCECEDDDELEDEEAESVDDDDDQEVDDGFRWMCGSLNEISSAHDILQRNGGTMAQDFVQEVVGANGIGTLLVTTAPPGSCSSATAWVAGLSAIKLAKEAGKVRVLVVSSSVFPVLRDVYLPKCIERVGVVDYYATGAFLRSVPATLNTLSRQTDVQSVWMADIPLREKGKHGKMDLKLAVSACRHAEADGICAAGMRGQIERWMQAS